MKKRKERAFGKNVYLLGKSKNDRYLWLEEPIWDCGWYWAFGYVEEYTNHKSPQNSKDVTMHTHWDSIHNDNQNPFNETTFSDSEYIVLKRLFRNFYKYKTNAEMYHDRNMTSMEDNINDFVIPEITKQIISILKPE